MIPVKAAGGTVAGIIGARTRDLIILEREMAEVADIRVVMTDDGSHGRKGLVTDALLLLLEQGCEFDEVVAVGPLPMMRAVCEVTRPLGLKTIVSLNPIMVDGTGMCGGCRVKVGDQVKFACVDGPDFDGHLVDFDDLMSRLKRYTKDEKVAHERWSESCRMTKQVGPSALDAVARGRAPQSELIELPDPFEDAPGG